MTVTETAPTTTDPAVGSPPDPESTVGGFAMLVGSGDHKTIGRLYMVTALLSLIATGVSGVLLGAERIDLGTSDNIIATDTFTQVFSLHSVGGIFLFLMPLAIGLALLIVPLQVGASTVAFPRAAAASFWTFLVSAGLVEASFVINGGPGGGNSDGVELFLVAMIVLIASHLMATMCIVTTVMTLRAPGMSLHRVPLFSWSNLVAGAMWLLTLPVLVGILVILFVDYRYFRDFTGGNTGIYARVAWVFGQPSIYLFAIPVLGFVGDVIPTFSGIRHLRHRVAMAAIGGFGILSLGAWAQLGFTIDFTSTPGTPFVDEGPWIAFGLLALVPLLVLLALWAGTMSRGKVKVAPPLTYGLGAGVVLFVGVAIGAVIPVDQLELVGTSASTAQAHAVIVAAVLALFGGLTYWSSKILGTSMASAPSNLIATVLTLGALVLVVPDLVAGALGPDDLDVIEMLNLVSLVGGVLVALGALGFATIFLVAAADKVPAETDPWEGHTLEWITDSPPTVGNFAEVPEITSEAPLYDLRHLEATS